MRSWNISCWNEKRRSSFSIVLVVAADALVAALPDRQTGRLAARHVDVARDCVARLVDRDGAPLVGDVLGPDRGARLERRHRLDEIVPARTPSGRCGARWSTPSSVACSIIAGEYPLVIRAISSRRFGRSSSGSWDDLPDVEVEDVEPIVLGRRPEPDVAAHAAGPDERGIEAVDRHVRRADEVDLVIPRPCGRQAQSRACRSGAGR